MMTNNLRNFVCIFSAVVITLWQSSCSTAAQALPTQTATEIVSTPLSTSTPEDTATPKPTSTSTETPIPTATITPNVTATQLPELISPAEEKGNVVGLVLWNDQPVVKAAVWLCREFTSAGCNDYKTNTDENGYYIFENVSPDTYQVAINSFSTEWFIFYFDSTGSKSQKVSAGENLILDPWSIWKVDLNVIYPRWGKAISEAHPILKWDPYPEASYYLLSLYDEKYNMVLENERVDGNEYALENATLVTCNYYWMVEAYSAGGKMIATTPGEYYFISIDLPGDC